MDQMSKPKMSDVLGALVTSVAYGRNVADVEAIRIARRYYQNDLLRGLPVPRLRMSKVSISLPLIISEVIPSSPAKRNDENEIAKKTSEALKNEIKSEKQRLDTLKDRLDTIPKEIKDTEDQQKAFKNYKEFIDCWVQSCKGEELKSDDQPLNDDIPMLENKNFIVYFQDKLSKMLKNSFVEMEIAEGGTEPSDISIITITGETTENALREVMSEIYYLIQRKKIEEMKKKKPSIKLMAPQNNTVSKKIETFDADWAKETLKEIVEDKSTEQLIRNVRVAAENTAISNPTIPPDFYVLVDTESIKNSGGGPDVVTRLNIVLHEEGLEWLSEKHNGQETTRLMPE